MKKILFILCLCCLLAFTGCSKECDCDTDMECEDSCGGEV